MQTIIAHRNRILTPEMISAARMLVMIAHPDNASLGRALERAAGRLLDAPWTVDCGILQIASHSHPGDVHSTDGTDCSCEATRGICWHVASWHILSAIAATGVAPVAAIPLPVVLDEDELPADSFLDGDFSAFEETTLLGPFDQPITHDEFGDIIPRPAPAFIEVDGPVVLTKRRPAPVPFRPRPAVVHGNPLDADVDALFAA